MRRNKIRKRNKISLESINNKSVQLLIFFVILIFICLAIYLFFFQDFFIKRNLEKDILNFSSLNTNIPFKLEKIILYSSATAITTDVNQSILDLDISQYCDIGLYINNLSKENTFINSIYINKFSISPTKLGTPCFYKKKIIDLGKCSFDENNILQDDFYFNIIKPETEINYNNYEIYNNGTTPISLGFYNKNIKENFLTDSPQIIYNGTLLRKAGITKFSINCSVSFCINITTTANEEYTCIVSFDIPFENENESIYTDGDCTKVISDTNFSKFIRVK